MKEDRRAVLSWCFYHWASGAFAITVMAGFFPVFFKSFWCAGMEPTTSTARLGFGDSVAGLAVALLSPLLGAMADAGRAKKKMLLLFLVIGVASTGALFLIQKGDWVSALVTFVIASIGFNGGYVFYDSLLIDVAEKERMDWVSSLGYSIGYLGMGLLFLLDIFMVSKPSIFHLTGAAQAVQYSFLTAAGWWSVFSIPLFMFVKERKYSELERAGKLISRSLSNLKTTFIKILHNRPLLLFLIAYWFYIDGLNTFILMSVDFGLSIGLKSQSLMISLLVVQFVAFPAALLFGWLSKRFGALAMILTGIAIYALVSVVGTFTLKNQLDFMILAGIIGLAQGGVQALSKSYYGKIIPPSESAEYFGFLNVVSRFAVIIGPALVGSVAVLTHKAGLGSRLASRAGMSSVSLLFVVGGILLVLADQMMKKKAEIISGI